RLGANPGELSQVLRGSTQVGVLMVSGPTEDLTLTDDDRQDIREKLLDGAHFLATAEPRAQVSFSYEFIPVTVNAPNATDRRDDLYFVFTLGTQTYLFWQSAVGWATIRPISGSGTIDPLQELWSEIWNPDYRIYMPFVLEGVQYFLTANTTSGAI